MRAISLVTCLGLALGVPACFKTVPVGEPTYRKVDGTERALSRSRHLGVTQAPSKNDPVLRIRFAERESVAYRVRQQFSAARVPNSPLNVLGGVVLAGLGAGAVAIAQHSRGLADTVSDNMKVVAVGGIAAALGGLSWIVHRNDGAPRTIPD